MKKKTEKRKTENQIKLIKQRSHFFKAHSFEIQKFENLKSGGKSEQNAHGSIAFYGIAQRSSHQIRTFAAVV